MLENRQLVKQALYSPMGFLYQKLPAVVVRSLTVVSYNIVSVVSVQPCRALYIGNCLQWLCVLIPLCKNSCSTEELTSTQPCGFL